MQAMTALGTDIAAFREFNRVYTRFLGALNEGLLNTGFSLAEARVLYELATRDAPRAKDISECLGMDAGYLSRILGKFEGRALLKRKAAEQDNRSAELALTKRGKASFNELNGLSDAQARGVLEPLTQSRRTELIHAMKAITEVLSGDDGGESRPPYVLRPHRIGDMGWVVSREGAVYAGEYGWDATFEALVAQIVADFITNFDPLKERCWIAEVGGQSMGHVFLVKHPEQPQVAKLRLLFVEPGARGLGLGHVLVQECIRFARTAGYKKIVLWTQSLLVAACRIYQKAGFRLAREEAHYSFGKDLVGQTWELDLAVSRI